MHVGGNRSHTGNLVVNLAPRSSYMCVFGQVIQLLRASVSSVQKSNNSLYGITWGPMCCPYSSECLEYSKCPINVGDYSEL